VVLVGTYTSIFIAAPILIYLGVGTNRADAADRPIAVGKPAKEPKLAAPAKKPGAPAKK
jgi:preprotein translocase subunit SecF